MSYYLIIRGPLGVGKTTIAEKLAEELGAKYFAVDRVLDVHHLTDDHEDGYISQKSFKKANELVIPEAEKSLKADTPVIFDGNFYWQSQIKDLIARLPYPHEVCTLTAPLDVCIERDSKRGTPHGVDAAGAVYEKSMSFTYGVPIDATRSIDECIKEIRRMLP
jgi:tRNA uridine 5-carbamoylmethylation protein Kti12